MRLWRDSKFYRKQSEQKNVAVLFGGRSVEHEYPSLLQLINVLDVVRYRLSLCMLSLADGMPVMRS